MARPAHTAPRTTGNTASTGADVGTGGLRERKKRATHQALQRAAVSLFREHGPHAVTVEDICAHADVSPRTFFNYFTSKEEVLVPWDQETITNTPERVLARPDTEEPLRTAQAVLGEAMNTAMSGSTWRDQAVILRENPELIERVVTAFRAMESSLVEGLARKRNVSCEDPYVRLVGATAITALRVSVQAWQESESDSSLHEYLDEAFEQLHRGLRPND
ncbi:DNA-binding transcriptional regulator, AcrR family [Actinopolyspora saharensis]|uniref:DNA-binding transcriptional regulator, AcrR family n=1 Tax=Actinopolyspora saharensis TaxID=995062 RepID=A0A1H1EMY7_9ACTN|nr:DNA-binding transcriptional regulator, AcrR family [Actinopolyspora saharensis]